jgi:leucyl aminopeptidase
MTGYVVPGRTPKIGVFTDRVSSAATQFIRELTSTYCDITSQDERCGYACSDHASWSQNGYTAAFISEGMDDDSPFIHTEKVQLRSILMPG